MSGIKTILIAHRHSAVRDRFAAALVDARHEYVVADTESAALAATTASALVSLILLDAGLASDAATFISALRDRHGAGVPVVVFAGTIGSADDVRALVALGVTGYINEHAATAQILPALAPFLFPHSFDRRSSPRIAIGLPLSYRAGQTIAGALTLNIGKGGLAIRTMSPLASGTPVHVKFRLPGAASAVAAIGRVAWSNSKVGMGVQFESVEEDGQQQIEQFVDTHG
jgi:uncharacterized protein (TIGR02266 family)